ncbi:DUF3574 domain-containing protein [Streptomyces rapamycinicus]|uniref:Choline dehydrogenase n=2 Tax=Streptomyces rapamycinicus TaxID=1226757 RepID=A0A0A0NND0_STRRN|nr:DUF3574 domain-containing protein [Streptomyces rapamycinicus]AGP55875.1 choline dehydrogenase [Streptomyces rapamycinicus NRRL 5491]RLV81066.1 choline dehydrogenase [Streptomyces rapamycinicus NRRL 5491]UTO63854.1 DUF3574 domain-containing protein [Streptomyces rapamycinicus]UTP31809.1 DUF3574 domain-containing protein [Streptomyces rapamycinicus NRRL 5491]
MPTMKPRVRLAAVGAAFALAAATPVAAYAALDDPPDAAGSGAVGRGKPYVETRLFFGTERPDGGPPVTEKQFLAFVDRRITPRFPSGLTIHDGRGQWRDQNGTIERERSYEVVLLYPASEAGAQDPRIERIRTAYERQYAQESVARADAPARVDF